MDGLILSSASSLKTPAPLVPNFPGRVPSLSVEKDSHEKDSCFLITGNSPHPFS